MKKTIPILAAIAVFLVLICVVQSKKLGKQETQVSSLNQELTEKSKRLDEIQAKAATPIAMPENVSSEQPATPAEPPEPRVKPNHPPRVSEVSEPAPATEIAPSADDVGSSKSTNGVSAFSKMISQMMQDPEAKKMLREQQRMALDQMYSPLIKRLAMTPEESDKLKNLLADQMMEGSAMLFGNQGSSRGSEALASVASAQTDLDNKVKELLGDDRYAEYKDYQLTVGERMQLSQFKQMLGDNPLTDQQTEQLLSIIKAEKKNVAGPNGEAFSGLTSNSKASMDAILADDTAMEKLLQTQNDLNDRVYQRANEVLSPDQLTAFGKFQTNQAAMMRLGVTMARKMFSDGGAEQGK